MNRIYCGPPPLPDQLWTSWNLDPVLILALAFTTWLARREPLGVLAVGVLILAFVSPLCALSSALFSARVVHHVLLVAVAAPLLGWAYRARSARGPGLPFGVATIILWAWHLPAAYDLALANVAVYWVMQLSLLGSAIWFWRVVFAREGTPVFQLLYIVANFGQMGMLGALLTFAPTELYAAHAFAPFDWGMTPLADQQLGGLIMWVPAGIPYAVAAFVMARQSWMRLKGDLSW
jgi:putative membrane protein